MKKRFLIIIMAAAFAFAFAGCGDDEKAVTTSDDEAASMEALEDTTAEETEQTAEATAAEEPTGTQTITMGNVEMEIPAKWVYQESSSSDGEHVYATADGKTTFSIASGQTSEDINSETLAENTEQLVSELGYEDIGYYDTTVGKNDSIEGKIIPVDKTQSANGMYQQVITIGKGKTFDILTCQVADYDYTDFNAALKTVRFIN